MNNNDDAVLKRLKEAVEDAASGAFDSTSPVHSDDGWASMAEQLAGGAKTTLEAGVSGVLSAAKPFSGLAGGASQGGGWKDLVSKINPLAGLIGGLFGGGDDPPEPPAIPPARPARRVVDAGFAGGTDPGIVAVSREEGGQFRPMARTDGAQVVVQIQAMDARSFLDRTPEIAQAVKQAMLESSNLRGVIDEY